MNERELIEDNLKNSDWIGEVINNEDPNEDGRVKVMVFGKFDELDEEDIPWATASNFMTGGDSSGSGSFSVPKEGSIVNVTFDNGNIYQPEYTYVQTISDALKTEITGDNYKNAHSLIYDTEIEGGLRIFYTSEKGLMLDLNGSVVNIRSDNTIFMQYNNGKVVHILKEMISLGKENKSDEPAVLGNKNVDALTEISDQIIELCTAIETASKTMTTVASSAPILAPLSAVWTPLAIQATKIKSFIKSKTKKNTISKTRSKHVSLDGPSIPPGQ